MTRPGDERVSDADLSRIIDNIGRGYVDAYSPHGVVLRLVRDYRALRDRNAKLEAVAELAYACLRDSPHDAWPKMHDALTDIGYQSLYDEGDPAELWRKWFAENCAAGYSPHPSGVPGGSEGGGA